MNNKEKFNANENENNEAVTLDEMSKESVKTERSEASAGSEASADETENNTEEEE